ncbi:MAG: hypothetical protein KatS3mg105_4757 [Gemmatales bacterium]|nr:MAG: hypothetical protein KatS3mg105_4757 [Gemmatales bacterium]
MNHMTLSAWVFMLTVWAIVIGCAAYCFYKLLTSERQLDDDDNEDDTASRTAG